MTELGIKRFSALMASELSRLSKDSENRKYMPDEVFETADAAEAAISLFEKRYKDGLSPQVYALTDERGSLVGHVEGVQLKDGKWEIGYHIGEDFRGRGYASKGLEIFIPFIMNRLGINEIYGICLSQNIASRRVLEKCGFELIFEGEGLYQGSLRTICRYVYRQVGEMDMEKKTRCVIIGSRDNGAMDISDCDFVMACDGGFANMGEIRPDMVVGDFDSLGYVPEGFEVLYHPPEKDDTDVMLAVREGLKRGYKDFVLYGCMGGRIDHAYANYQVLAFITAHGGRAVMKGDGWNVTHICDRDMVIEGGRGKVFSVFAHGGEAEVTIRNAKYELEGYKVTPDFPIGVSNERLDGEAGIKVKGKALVMWED